ncbi:DUF6356 family protein [Sphingomonas donggukensis]|uniref:DUF6356 family protein n=1 Tax=Sphingomonas donggukensis TaxID=2949093 RepID=A0ABY4TWU4_9SPHN|nr:DUF6356 family protein [Sphingomonas donggukensis]URW76862.1 DUF6356 family protein [Sphingomonas donggukensis]
MHRSPLHRWFVDHPRSVNESYTQHFGVATRFGVKMIVGGIAALVHGVVPSLFERTGSTTIKGLYSEMVARQPGARRPAYDEPEWRPEYEI